MKLIDLTCPHCGASLKVDADKKQASCEHCGATFMIDDEAQHVIYDNAEQAGYDFEKGRQRAQRDSVTEQETRIPKQTTSSTYQNHPSSSGGTPQKKGCLSCSLIFVVCALLWGIIASVPKRSSTTSHMEVSSSKYESASTVTTLEERSSEISGENRTSSMSDAQRSISRITENAANARGESVSDEAESETSGSSSTSTTTGYRNTSLNGRGDADSGRNEPHYVGVIGYVAVYYSQTYAIERTDDFANEELWTVPTYEQDKQFWSETGTLPHKTEVVVLWQSLKHEGYGRYSGYLKVETTSDHSQYYIDVKNFITKPYWTYTDLHAAAIIGDFVAEYNQVSDYWPVDSSGNKLEIPNGTKVLVKGLTGLSGRYDQDETDLTAVVWKEWKLGYGDVDCHFNSKDLKIVY